MRHRRPARPTAASNDDALLTAIRGLSDRIDDSDRQTREAFDPLNSALGERRDRVVDLEDENPA